MDLYFSHGGIGITSGFPYFKHAVIVLRPDPVHGIFRFRRQDGDDESDEEPCALMRPINRIQIGRFGDVVTLPSGYGGESLRIMEWEEHKFIVTQRDMPPLLVTVWPKKEVRPIRPEEFNALSSYYIYL